MSCLICFESLVCWRYKTRRFDPWVGKIPWRRSWQSSPVFLPGNPMDRGARWPIVYRIAKSQTLLKWLSMHQKLKIWWCLSSQSLSQETYLSMICSMRLGMGLSDQIRSVAQSCPTLCDPWITACQASLSITKYWSSLRLTSIESSDAIQPSHPPSSPSPHAPNPSQHQSLFQWVNSSHEVAKVLEFQL